MSIDEIRSKLTRIRDQINIILSATREIAFLFNELASDIEELNTMINQMRRVLKIEDRKGGEK